MNFWHYLDQFARDYPQVQLQRQHLLTQAGRIYCAASVNSGADMMVHFIGLQYDRTLAHIMISDGNQVGRELVTASGRSSRLCPAALQSS